MSLDDGRVELGNNVVERPIWPITLGRKNALFAGADSGGRHWVIVACAPQARDFVSADPLGKTERRRAARLSPDVLERLIAGHPIDRVQDLVPCAYPASMPRATACFRGTTAPLTSHLFWRIPLPLIYSGCRKHASV